MPQGLQVWDQWGNLVVDTSTFILKDLKIVTVTNSNTATNSIPVNIPANTVVVPSSSGVSSSANSSGGSYNDLPDVSYSSGNLNYTWSAGGGTKEARVGILLV